MSEDPSWAIVDLFALCFRSTSCRRGPPCCRKTWMPAAAGGEDEGFGRAVKETGDKHSFGSRAVERGARLFERNSSLTLHCDFPFRRASVALREFFFFFMPT